MIEPSSCGVLDTPPSRSMTICAGRPVAPHSISQLPRIAECERRQPPCVLVQDQCPRDRRLGALAAIFALAEPAVDADRRTLGFFQIYSIAIHEARCMTNFTAEPNGKARLWLRVRRHRPAHHLRDRKISGAIGQFDDLLKQPVRGIEGRVHIPISKTGMCRRKIAWRRCPHCRRAA